MTRALIVAPLLLAACPPAGGPECGAGIACASDEVCANTMECWPAGDTHAVTVRWTIGGAAPSASNCPDPSFMLTIWEGGAEGRTWHPVPCANGQFGFDKLPTIYDQVSVTVDNVGTMAFGDVPAAGGDVLIDLP